MTDVDHETRPRQGMHPENVAVLVLAALTVGLILGQAIGRRQGLEVKQVVLPEAALTAEMPAGDVDEAMAETAPAAPETVADARRMVEMMGDADAAELITLGDRKFGNGVYYLAIGFYEKALAKEPDHPDTWVHLGAARHEVGLNEEALDAFAEALRRQPDHPVAWYNRGIVTAALGQRQEAVTAFEKYLALAPQGELAAEARNHLATLRG